MYHLANEKLYEYPQTLPVFDVANFARKTLSMRYPMKYPPEHTLTLNSLTLTLFPRRCIQKEKKTKTQRRFTLTLSESTEKRKREERFLHEANGSKKKKEKRGGKEKKSKNKYNRYIGYRAMISLSESARMKNTVMGKVTT